MSAPATTQPQNTTEKAAPATSETRLSPTNTKSPNWVDALLFWVEWGIKVLGVAAALVFGIWAPLSYQAANNANSDGDAAQSSIISYITSAASEASSQASRAMDIQSTALESVNSRIGAIGQLWLLDFCITNTQLAACQSFTDGLQITSLVGYLASDSTFQSSTPRPTNTVTSEPNPSSGGQRPKKTHASLTLPAILGIVFAVILFLGVIAGIFVSRLKRRRRGQFEE